MTIHDKITDLSIGSMLSMRKSTHPSYVIELSNFSIDTPIIELEELIKSNKCDKYYLYSDRYALIKFRRHQLVSIYPVFVFHFISFLVFKRYKL